MEKGLMHKSASEDNKKEGLLQNSAVKSRGSHTKKCWQPRLFAIKLSCENQFRAFRA